MARGEGFDTSKTVGELCSAALRRLRTVPEAHVSVMDPFIAEKLLSEGHIERAGGASSPEHIRLTDEGREMAEADRRARQALRQSRRKPR